MARSINVKIATGKLVSALEDKVVALEAEIADYKAEREKFNNTVESWESSVLKAAGVKRNEFFKDVRIATPYNAPHHYEIEVKYYIPVASVDERPVFDNGLSTWENKEAIKEIGNAIRILKMTDQEEVSTSTYNAVSRYL
jgi:hypothetical protein